MSLTGKTVLVSGATRGLGAATVRALLKAGVKKIYAGARRVDALPDFKDARVVPLQLDVTSEASVSAAALAASDVEVLLNNAGTMQFGDVLSSARATIDTDFDTNFFGTLRVVRAFAPTLVKRGSGIIANVVSVVGLAPVPVLGGYSASKAALHSLTLALRGTLAKSGITVIGIYPGPLDTELAKNLPLAKAGPDDAAQKVIEGLEAATPYIFPDPTAQQIEYLWAHDGSKLEAAMQAGG